MNEVRKTVCSYSNLYQALKKCKKNVMWKDSVIGYSKNRLVNIAKLKTSLDNDTYELDPYITFTIHEPKTREIVSTRLKDRVFQRSLCDNYIYPELTRHFIYDNCACQIGKGTDFTRRRMVVHLQRFYRKNGQNGYILKCDLKDYFGSTNHEMAKAMLRKKIRDDWAYEQIAHIVDSFKGEKGIGLGSQVSQLIQLAVLDDLDHIIKERFKIKQYIRFMDDFVLIHEDKSHLAMIRTFIEDYLTSLGLVLSKKKTMLQKISQPFHFMGFSYRLTETGKIIRKILKPKIKHEKRKYKGLLKQVANKKMSPKQLNECLTAWRAHARKGNTHNLILKIDKYFKERKLNYGNLS